MNPQMAPSFQQQPNIMPGGGGKMQMM